MPYTQVIVKAHLLVSLAFGNHKVDTESVLMGAMNELLAAIFIATFHVFKLNIRTGFFTFGISLLQGAIHPRIEIAIA